MEDIRGYFTDQADDMRDYDRGDDAVTREAPPLAIGQDERRMQVRAYNHWASLLEDRNFPSIEDLDPETLTDFGPFSVLLDFTSGIDNPSIPFLGEKLAEECNANRLIEQLSDVPSRSLLSRITDHYMQILANQAPIGFEAEFLNQRGRTSLYRGILLPYSSDGETIDFIYGVINWKEVADQITTDELMLEIDQMLDMPFEAIRLPSPLPEWTDKVDGFDDVLELTSPLDPDDSMLNWPAPIFGAADELMLGVNDELAIEPDALPAFDLDETFLDETFLDGADTFIGEEDPAIGPSEEPAFSPLIKRRKSSAPAPVKIALGKPSDDDMDLADWLASARELAQAAQGSEDRSRSALYDAIGRAYDFSLVAAEQPEEMEDLIADAGLTMQDRAPMTPIVKLVFGADYDKTRLTEYAAALSHAHRLSLKRGALSTYLGSAQGGLKGVVNAERRLRREEAGKALPMHLTTQDALSRKLRKLVHAPLDSLPADGEEFTLLVARRLPDGEVVLLGEVADDIPLLERAARRLLD